MFRSPEMGKVRCSQSNIMQSKAGVFQLSPLRPGDIVARSIECDALRYRYLENRNLKGHAATAAGGHYEQTGY